MSNIKISVLESDTQIDGYETSYCKLQFTGNDINHVIINTLRRVILTLIPIYGFDTDNINITTNTSIFNNDQLRLRLSSLPIFFNKELNKNYKELKKLNYDNVLNPENTINEFSDLEYCANVGTAEIEKVIYEKEKHINIVNNLTITINLKNTSTTNIMNVMSNTPGVKYYFAKEQISHIYTNPLLLLQLQPLQEISLTMISNLNNALFNALYRCCTHCHYEEIDNNTYNFEVYSRRQITEKDIIIRACKILIIKINNSKNIIINNFNNYIKKNDEDNYLQKGIITIEGEQYTLGNLFSRYMQDHDEINFAGYKVGHPNVSQVIIKYDCKSNIIKVIDDVCIKIINIYNNILDIINNLNNFGYNIY